MKCIVIGGAGYVGSTVFDDLSTGHRDAVQWGELIVGSATDHAQVADALKKIKPDIVMHFAAKSLIGESVVHPLRYYESNVSGMLVVLSAMKANGISKLVFSSTAAVFGQPEGQVISEDHVKNPINPYGRSKLMAEWLLYDVAASCEISSVTLRYFNAAGADPFGRIGEAHDPETHLIPLLLGMAAGEVSDLKIFGEHYPTRDGTCVRDYVHVTDLADAHLRAANFLQGNEGSFDFNLGNGRGFSVREVVCAVEAVIGRSLRIAVGDKRVGDPATLVADSRRAAHVLGWQPKRTDLTTIVNDAWRWRQQRMGSTVRVRPDPEIG